MESESKFLNGFVGSMLVHIAILILFFVLPTPKPPEAPLTFDVIDLSKSLSQKKSQHIIRELDLPDQMTSASEEDRLRFLSDKTRRVKEELRALQNGLTKNRSQTSPNQPQKNNPKSQSQIQDRSNENSADGLARFMPNKKIAQNNQQQDNPNSEPGVSTLADELPQEIKVGAITSVDTDHFLYYSYFSRAQELLWNEWAPMVQSVLYHPPSSLRTSSQNHFVTVLEAWFLPNGQLHSIHILKPSGIPELDYVATTSFKRVGMIPNPPREKMDPDGLIRFKWSLAVDYDPKVLVR